MFIDNFEAVKHGNTVNATSKCVRSFRSGSLSRSDGPIWTKQVEFMTSQNKSTHWLKLQLIKIISDLYLKKGAPLKLRFISDWLLNYLLVHIHLYRMVTWVLLVAGYGEYFICPWPLFLGMATWVLWNLRYGEHSMPLTTILRYGYTDFMESWVW